MLRVRRTTILVYNPTLATRIQGFYGTNSRHFIRRRTFSLLANVFWFQHGSIPANIPTIRCPQRCLLHHCPMEKVASAVRNMIDLNIKDDLKRKRALLLHYAGEEINNIFEKLCQTLWGEKQLSGSYWCSKRTFRSHSQFGILELLFSSSQTAAEWNPQHVPYKATTAGDAV